MHWHMKKQSLDQKFQCPVPFCSLTYSRPSDLKCHFTLKHYDRIYDFPDLVSKGKYECKLCGIQFSRARILTRHVKHAHGKLKKNLKVDGKGERGEAGEGEGGEHKTVENNFTFEFSTDTEPVMTEVNSLIVPSKNHGTEKYSLGYIMY